MTNYAEPLPRDKTSTELLQEFPAPVLALQRYGSENAVASSVISVTHDTTVLEVTAIGTAATLKWIATGNTNPSVISAAATANYDHVIAPNITRRFVIPIESNPAYYGSMMGVNRLNGLYQRVAIKSMGIASVLVSEF